jgi:hypothetical protein
MNTALKFTLLKEAGDKAWEQKQLWAVRQLNKQKILSTWDVMLYKYIYIYVTYILKNI